MVGMTLPDSHPKHPERICWGCAKLCRADDLACGNGTVRTPHPCELFGDEYDAVFSSDSNETSEVLQGAPLDSEEEG